MLAVIQLQQINAYLHEDGTGTTFLIDENHGMALPHIIIMNPCVPIDVILALLKVENN